MPLVAAQSSGLLDFIRYAFMPNHLGYCGGNEQEVLFEHAAAGQSDQRLAPLLAKFTGAFPYLRTIAVANHLADPFDARVVEAYWLGNELLDRVGAAELYRSLEERFGRQLTGRVREQVLRKPPQGARPYHLFHVLDVYRHLEHEGIAMATMESCRISWGQVRAVEGTELVVRRQPLELSEGKLALGEAVEDRVLRSISDRGFADEVVVGDWVSIHWGWTCEVLDGRKLANLRRWSEYHLALANQTV
ncbi:MAG: hypothetical protein KY438_06630 [Actinobacteria bacterium]|nr:hypothetical protein [Actinomycetota bacterium]